MVAVATADAHRAPGALPTPTTPPAASVASHAPTATITLIASANAASGEGIAGFLGLMAVLGGGALVLKRFGPRGGRR